MTDLWVKKKFKATVFSSWMAVSVLIPCRALSRPIYSSALAVPKPWT